MESTEVRHDRFRRSVDAAIEEARDMVAALCRPRGTAGAREWVLRIPADAGDPDIVIDSAFAAAADELERLRAALGKIAAGTTGNGLVNGLRWMTVHELRDCALDALEGPDSNWGRMRTACGADGIDGISGLTGGGGDLRSQEARGEETHTQQGETVAQQGAGRGTRAQQGSLGAPQQREAKRERWRALNARLVELALIGTSVLHERCAAGLCPEEHGFDLWEALQASRLVARENAACDGFVASAGDVVPGAFRRAARCQAVVDDRLLAALYVALEYEPHDCGEAQVIARVGNRGVCVVRLEEEAGEGNGEEEGDLRSLRARDAEPEPERGPGGQETFAQQDPNAGRGTLRRYG